MVFHLVIAAGNGWSDGADDLDGLEGYYLIYCVNRRRKEINSFRFCLSLDDIDADLPAAG